MKLISKFLNTLFFCLIYCIVTILLFGSYNLAAISFGSDRVISLKSDSDSEDFSYFDAYTTMGTDITGGINQLKDDPEYYARTAGGKLSGPGWQTQLQWADYAISGAKSVIMPIFGSGNETKELLEYYTDYTVDGETEININENNISVELNLNHIIRCQTDSTNYELFYKAAEDNSILNHIYVEANLKDLNGRSVEIKKNYIYLLYKNTDINNEYDYVLFKCINTNASECSFKYLAKVSSTDYAKDANSEELACAYWKRDNRAFINTIYKINKYNQTAENANGEEYKIYENLYNKLITPNNYNKVVTSYFLIYAAFIISFLIVYEYPIVIKTNEDGEGEVHGGLKFFNKRKRKKHHWHRFKRKKVVEEE